MQVTLEKMMNLEKYEGKSPLEVKAHLVTYKKLGVVFIDKEVCSVEEGERFQLYFVYQPSHKSKVNAFPVPIEDYRMYRTKEMNHEQVYTYMKTYFDRYYENEEFNRELFKQYDQEHVYIAEDYVWYYKRIA